MSTGFLISDREWEATREVSLLARTLYYAMRRRMDFSSGIVGTAERAVSWWALREDLEVPGRPGVKRYLPSEQQLRRCMVQLVKAGLVESIGDKLRLCFRLLLARTDKFGPKKAEGGAIDEKTPGKNRQDKAGRAFPQGNSVSKAGTHLTSGKTLKPSPPTPSGLRPAGDGSIDPPAPAAQEVGNPDAKPIERDAPGLSEARREPASGGERPAAGHPDNEVVSAITWEAHLDWPTGITQEQRGYIARSRGTLTKTLLQRVLDEWRGAMQAGIVLKPWPYFNQLLRNAKAQGDAWKTEYAEAVAQAREAVRLREAEAAAKDAEYSQRLGGTARPMEPGGLARFARADAARAVAAQRARRRA